MTSYAQNNVQRRSLALLLGAGTLLSSLLQIALLIAVYLKGGGTTGAWPVVPIFPFVTLALIAAVVAFWKRAIVKRTYWIMAATSGLFGSLLPFWLELTGALVEYENAVIHRTFQLERQYILLPLVVFGLIEAAAMGIAWYLSSRCNSYP